MAPRLILSLEDISLRFGTKLLFEGLHLHLAEHDHVCLVGKNGAGKTTLMRLMVEDLELDSGKRFVLPGTRIGYLAQSLTFSPQQSIKDFVLSGLPSSERNEENHYLADMVIAPLGLEASARMGTLSGGQLRRCGLAQALVQDPDILLLDEPTNHLDLQAIEWLEGYLQSYRGIVVCVSHDRAFLSAISQKVLWVDGGRVVVCPHSYSAFDDWLEQRVQQEARELQNLQKKVAAEHDWTQGGVSGRRKRNQRRLRELGRLREKLQRDKAAYLQRSMKLDMDALETPTASKIVAEFRRVEKHFSDEGGQKKMILKDFNHTIMKGDRLGILGKNGSGKSSFLKLLTGEMNPDSGTIFRSKTLDISYFDQSRSALNPNKTLWETLCPDGGHEVFLGQGENRKSMHVCGYLKKFLFDPKAAHDKVATLSGGQQNRLLLAKILSSPGNLLILDEPTNDLDMDTLDMLHELLSDFPGTLIIVSHDRDFLDRTVTELLAFEGDGHIEQVYGGYSDYMRQSRARKGQSSAQAQNAGNHAAVASPALKAKAKPESSPLLQAKTLRYSEQVELSKLPDRISSLQSELKSIEVQLASAELYSKDPDRFHALITAFEKTRADLNSSEARWLELEERQSASSA